MKKIQFFMMAIVAIICGTAILSACTSFDEIAEMEAQVARATAAADTTVTPRDTIRDTVVVVDTVVVDTVPTPTPGEDSIVSRRVIRDGFDYITPSTSRTWCEIEEVWSSGRREVYTKSVNLNNGIVAPASITVVVTAFDQNSRNAVLGGERQVGRRTSGEFVVYSFERTFTVGSESVTREFVLRWEKAVWTPMSYDMPFKVYESITDNGFNSSNMSDEVSGGNTYNRKSYSYHMSALFNARGANASASAVQKVLVVNNDEPEDPRTTPSWLGQPMWAKYTRVQKSAGQTFEDMVVFGYQNGVVMAPNGNPDLVNGVFAYDQSVATAHGVTRCVRNADYSGVWTGSGWIPAKITNSNGRWIYQGVATSHTVMENNAINLGIGVEVTHTPSHQSYEINNGTITLHYKAGNSSLTPSDLISLR